MCLKLFSVFSGEKSSTGIRVKLFSAGVESESKKNQTPIISVASGPNNN